MVPRTVPQISEYVPGPKKSWGSAIHTNLTYPGREHLPAGANGEVPVGATS